ncbi:4'-phosphopantetheinyl transferase family protein [Pseudonocardia nigra]|uniref:4'-phosphopantetheinyl transferase family protein n=1 Tax=Pseudonocardia nigra TaxID=1921578 RepID=UPI001C5E898E|nr:4'-phosphopantetheinyl transferase superfamily protein [Pseudonocardia nigra]
MTLRPVHVWWAAPVAPAAAPALVALLDAHERERLHRFRRPADQGRYLAAHALARLVLAGGRDPADLEFDRTCRCGEQHGKPALPGGPEFSLTHAGDLVGVAVGSDLGIGLDVEQVRELSDLAAMAAHVCSPAETAPDAAAFFTLWARKEALLKATGDGLSSPMAAITLDDHGVREWTGESTPAGPVWVRDLHPAPGYRAAVAGFGALTPEIREADGVAVIAAAR